MSFIPIDFENEPSEKTPVSAENLNYMQQGIVLAVDRSRLLDETWKNGSLKGDKGDRGTQGENGLQGDAGPKGDTGTHGEKGPQGVQGQQGERGSDGVFNIDLITQDQLKALHEKLTPLNNDQHWKYRSYIASGQTVRIPIADLNLILRVNRVSATAINYQFFPADSTKPAVYYVNRLSNYDLVAWESTVTSGWVAQPITNAGFVLDASGYLPGREHTDIEVIDPNTGIWYSIRMIGLGEGTMFFDVIKRAVHEREIIAPS